MQKEAFLYVSDNTGVVRVKCIHIFGGSFIRKGTIGNFIALVIPGRRKSRVLLTKYIYPGLLIADKKEYKRLNGFYIKMDKSKVLLLTEQGKLLGTKIKGLVDMSLRNLSCFKTYPTVINFI